MLNNSVELSSNLDKPVPLTSGIRTPLLTQSVELLRGSQGFLDHQIRHQIPKWLNYHTPQMYYI